MSERTYTKAQAQQKPLIGSSPKSSLLQRTCACGQHTIAGGECSTCRSEQSTLLRSQRTSGSPSTSTLAQENAPFVNSSSGGASPFGHDFSRIPVHSSHPPMFQTKLKINQPGDVYEQEADRVAEQVMRMTDLEDTVSDDDDEAKNSPMRKQSGEPGAHEATDASSVPPIVPDMLNSGGGQPLDATTRAFMEPRFGHDFSKVRVHADERAGESALAVNALAYTVGRDVIFGQGQYAPETSTGRRLLAHELTHVVQQRGRDRESLLTTGQADDGYKREVHTIDRVATQSSTNVAAENTNANIIRMSNGSLIQRQPATGRTQARLTEVERSERVLEKRVAATELDLRWRATFGERIASYRQAILRISGGLDAATQGFQSAQVAQAQTDALKTQLIGGLLAIGFAAGFEWAFGALLGALGTNAKKIETIIEAVENPANAAVSARVNVAGVETSKSSTEKGQTPAIAPSGGAPVGGAMSYLTSNLEALEHHSQEIEQAFINRSQKMQGFSNEQWEKFDPATQESTYQQLLSDLKSSASGVESLKPAPIVARVLERHLWALWLAAQAPEWNLRHSKAYNIYWEERLQKEGAGASFDLGTDIETRLNQIGVSELAGITLTGHWYSSNSSYWQEKLYLWMKSYKETIKI